MSSSTEPRIQRGPAPTKPIKRHKYRKALPYLIRDFFGRCAYSMQHFSRAGNLEVDHFNPKLKDKFIQDYNNLFPASRHCNSTKSNKWPNHDELAAGCRFLNPCREMDYGEQIWEQPMTHLLIGTTSAAKWHIRMCGLNAFHLVDERAKRARYLDLLQRTPVLIKRDLGVARQLINNFKEEVELMIPEIPPAPIDA
jgi:hypothetical protein